MRTEGDLRAAFCALADQAPDAAAVRLRTEAGIARAGARRSRMRWRVGGGFMAALTVAVVAVLVVATRPAAPALSRPPAALGHVALRAKLLAAMDSTADEILVASTTVPASQGGGTFDFWYYPWGAQPGQQVQSRSLESHAGKLSDDHEFIYTEPATEPPSPSFGAFLGGAGKPIPGEMIDVNYDTRTWSDQTDVYSSPGQWDPSFIRAQLTAGIWTVSGPVPFDGHQALELTERYTNMSPPTAFTLWVDADTYLPLRGEFTSSGSSPVWTDFQLLPATPASLGQLKVVIPAGFSQQTFPVSTPSPSATP
jgi:hypothetical protein